MGKVGNDPFGHFLAGILNQEGVDTQQLLLSDEAKTGLAFVSLKSDGDREFMFYRDPSADILLRHDEIDPEAIKAAKLLHFGSISLICEPIRSATFHALKIARESGCQISYDANLRLALWPDEKIAREGLLLGLAQANIVKLSEDELEFLTDNTDLKEAAKALWHDDLKLLIVTQGRDGCYFMTPDHEGKVDSFDVETIDATGAGDAFVAGLLQGILKDPSAFNDFDKLSVLCRFANASAAISTTRNGAIPALPCYEEVHQFLIDHQ